MESITFKELLGYNLHATDKDLGKVQDIYFDDISWKIRYLAVHTRKWLPGKKILLSPVAIRNFDSENNLINVEFTSEELKDFPTIGEAKPISRVYEEKLTSMYAWPVYWPGGVTPDMNPMPDQFLEYGHSELPKEFERVIENRFEQQDPNLRSCAEILHYPIHATDGEIGEVRDFHLNLRDWTIPYLFVRTGQWFSGKTICVPQLAVEDIDWSLRTVNVCVEKLDIEYAPKVDPRQPVGDDVIKSYFSKLVKRRQEHAPPVRSASQ